MNRLHVSVRAEPGGTHMLAVWRPAPSPITVAAQRATQAECLALAQRITTAVYEMDTRAGCAGPDLLELIHAAERAAYGCSGR